MRVRVLSLGALLVLLPTPSAATGGEWRWPLAGVPPVVRGFEPPAETWLAGHRGVDLAAPPGSPVLAAGAGVVGHAGPVAGRGVVTVLHEGGLRTTYEPVDPVVEEGERVAPGDRLGSTIGVGAHCLAGCLHWGLRREGAYLDPLTLLGGGPVRLLPLGGRRWGPPGTRPGDLAPGGPPGAGQEAASPGASDGGPPRRVLTAAGIGGAVAVGAALAGRRRSRPG